MKKIDVKYFSNFVRLEKIKAGDWIDLRATETIELKAGEYKIIPLGVAMKLPKNYEAWILPRSSTFKRWGIILVNGMGIIDNSYQGDADQWGFPAYATRDTIIQAGDRICQFRIHRNMPRLFFRRRLQLSKSSRGGYGSTGVQ